MTSYNDYSIAAYGRMITDERRTTPFVDALRHAVGPDSVVLDIGTGTGIFSFLACQFGAARVYAVEPDADAIEVAKRCAQGIPGSERITWIHGLTTDRDLPEQVDVVIGDLHGTLPFFKGNIESMADARKRHLKPGGRMIPSRDVLHAAPATAADEYKLVEVPWRSNGHGIDLSAALPYVVNQWWRARAEPIDSNQLLAEPQTWGIVDYTAAETSNIDHTLTWEAERAGTMHGLYVWFDGDLGEGFGTSNAPYLPELVYGRAFFPLEHPVEVAAGDRISTRLVVRLVKGNHVFRWLTRIHGKDGTPKARFDQSTFKAQPTRLADIRKVSAEHVPVPGEHGLVTHAALQAMLEGKPLGAIAELLATRFPQQFKSVAQALDEASRISRLYA